MQIILTVSYFYKQDNIDLNSCVKKINIINKCPAVTIWVNIILPSLIFYLVTPLHL